MASLAPLMDYCISESGVSGESVWLLGIIDHMLKKTFILRKMYVEHHSRTTLPETACARLWSLRVSIKRICEEIQQSRCHESHLAF